MNADAFTVMATREQPRLIRFCARLLRSGEDAEDVSQETLTRAWIARERILPDADSQARLLMTIARNLCLDRLRHQAVVDRHVRALRIEYAPDASVAALLHIDIATLCTNLTRLKPMHRELLLLSALDGYSQSQIAAASGVSLGTIKSRLFRAQHRIREMHAA